MLNTHTFPHRAVKSTPAIAFYVLFSLAALVPIILVGAAIANWPLVILAVVIVLVLYDTICQLGILKLAWDAMGQDVQRQHQRQSLDNTLNAAPGAAAPTLTVVIPAWNEQAALPRTLDTVLTQADPPEMILVVDDGSTDATIADLTVRYELEFNGIMGRSRLYPHLFVLCKPHSGKANSLNQAIAQATTEVVLVLDADTQLLPGGLAALRRAFGQDPTLNVVGGVFLPRCSRRWRGRLFEFIQRYEYARSHLWRLAWSHLDSALAVPGACSAFRRETLLAIGGFNARSWVEDYEVIYRMQRHLRTRWQCCRVRVEPGLRVYTQAPETIQSFLRQRRRWSGGFVETMWQHREMVGNARYGLIGRAYLVYNTLRLPAQLLYVLAGITMTTIGLVLHQALFFPTGWFGLLWLKGVLDIAMSLGGIAFYNRYFQRREVSLLGVAGELPLNLLLLLPLLQISNAWGWVSCWYRRANW